MEERKKVSLIVNIVVRPVVLITVFVLAFIISTGILNRNNQGITAEMADCTFPTITALYKGQPLNRMYGYADELSPGGIRSSLTFLNEQNKLDIQIQTFGTAVHGIRYQVRSMDMERLIEDTPVEGFQETEGRIDVNLNIQDLLEDNKDYLLVILLDTEVDQNIYYYTRIRKDGEYFAEEYLNFAKNFHDKTRNKNSGDDIIRYLESSSEGDNSSFQSVNIHSSYDLVTWGDLEILSMEDVDVSLQDLNNQTAVITIDYMIILKNSNDELEHYDVSEYYRLRYTRNRMYLLDFERTMNQFFEIENGVIYSTAVQLGITDSNVQYMSTKDAKTVSFVQEGELFSYNSSEHSLAKVFGFWKQNGDVRYRNDQHRIQIINVDEKGSMDFVIYGYMNRGIHEGKVGVSVCHYDGATNSTEEYVFLESDKSYQILKEEVGQLVYINQKGRFYIHLQKNIYEIDKNSKQIVKLAENIELNEFAVSSDHSLLVIQNEKDLAASVGLNYMDLKSGKDKTISCQENERIRPIGFIGTDFIYGLARIEDIYQDGTGQTVFPMYKIMIVNTKGEVKKEYEPGGIYVLQAYIEDHILKLNRAVKAENGYTAAAEDQIIHNAGKTKDGITLKSITTDRKKREYQLDFGFSLSTRKKKCLKPKEVLLENVKNLVLEKNEDLSIYYYVYSKGNLDNMYISATDAVLNADESAGVVVNQKQEYIYERIRRQTQQQISGVETVSIASGYHSLEACLISILRFNGNGADAREMLQQGMSPQQILQQELGRDKVVNLTGTPLDKVLYCIDRGYPVLAAVPDGNYVLLVGYNELNTIVMDPVKGTTGYVGMNDSRAMFEAAGNSFVACIP